MPSHEGPPDPQLGPRVDHGGAPHGAPQVLDQAYLAACLAGGLTEAKLLKMAGVFELRLEEERLAMREALEAGDLGGLGAGAHRLKGSAGSLGFLGIRSCAAALEEAAKAGQQSACRSLLASLPAVSAATLRAFRAHLGFSG